ncbi:MAG: AAA family ATPase [Chloroflexi bacterium]|nr:AAA family ATPase [Chloroflexota bacterium]
MYRSFTIKNFRCFDELTVEGMGRINLIAGKNNVGKTALLEALWVHHGAVNPDVGVRIGTFRGLDAPSLDNFLADLFHRFNRGGVIELLAIGDWSESPRELRISCEEVSTVEVPLPRPRDEQHDTRQTSSTFNNSSSRVVFDYTFGPDVQLSATGRLVEQIVGPGVSTIAMEQTQRPRPYQENGIFLAARRTGVSNEDVQRYSQLEVAGQEGKILDILEQIEPSLGRLAVVATGQETRIYGEIGLDRLIPFQLMGDGMSRLLSVALAIATAPGGIVLVDEIENGIHHSVMEKVWKAIGAFAHSYDVQLFATTHSYECIGAAYRAFESDEEDELRLFRIERSKEGKFRAVKFDRERLGSVLQFNMEVI